MSTPRATARLQLHAGFTFNDARAQIPYYARLGISHFYLSPISRARPGSTHGYDVVDHQMISPELGGEGAFIKLARDLQDHAMGIILDIVPNHMATHPGNRWWWDVLRYGEGSAYAGWFDIDWNSPDQELRGKVLAPFLAESYGQTLNGGHIKLVFDQPSQTFQIQACDARYPLAPGTLDKDAKSIFDTLAQYDPVDARGRQRLHELLQRQHYVLSWWRCAADRINWRRFFEISDLIGLCVERQPVFEAVHALPLQLFAEGLI
ncbi:MAG: alpha-amylase family glycosyl hydrolase, partial [Burkholderiaceae bacterium]